jgi:hypothetical protein
MYEPIRGRDDPEQENKCAVLHSSAIEEDEDDVEMAVHARSRLAIPNAAGGFNKIQEESSKQKQQQQQRLVSLDVFRGITVAVILSPRLLSLILLHCFFFFPSSTTISLYLHSIKIGITLHLYSLQWEVGCERG